MRRHLDNFVRNEMFKGQKPPPNFRRRFYPRRKDLDYHISKAKLANRLATLDQDNLEALIEQWRSASKGDMFHFRKREAVREKCGRGPMWMILQRTTRTPRGIDDEEEPEPSPQDGEQSLLFCCQTEKQNRLLQKYGNYICLMDATYKTTRYALPLFFLCVRTNVCYQVKK